MLPRAWVRGPVATRLVAAVERLNARHPWSHNDHFHGWILSRLPARRRRALDVGCGRGELLAVLAPYVEEVRGIDVDPDMRRAAGRRCAGLDRVTVTGETLGELAGPFDLVTMVAALHHLDEPTALRDVRRLLAPGGRFVAVGLAAPHSLPDHVWDLASAATNPVIGYVKHPWVSRAGPRPPTVPVRDPTLSYAELGAVVREVMPGARLRRRLAFRHTIEWTKPVA